MFEYIEWGSFWTGVAAVPVTVAAVAAVGALLYRTFDKNLGLGGCHVCDQGFECEPGQYTRLGIWVRSRRHNWFICSQRWHRDAWARNRWNPYRLPGYPEDTAQAALRRRKPNVLVRAWWAIAH